MMIVIGGPGTGKSMLAVNLASYWHGLQRRVLLIDADPRLASMQWGSRASLRQAPAPAIMGAVMAPWDTLRQLSFDYKETVLSGDDKAGGPMFAVGASFTLGF